MTYTKPLFVLLLVLMLSFGAAVCCSAVEVSGQVIAITGANDLIVKDQNGKKVNVKIDTSKLKVGDNITIREGIVTRKATNPAPEGPKRIKSFRTH